MNDSPRQFLRHTIATLAYRGGKTLRGAPEGFGEFRPLEGVRTPVEIVAHLGDLFDWALTSVRGVTVWRAAVPQAWDLEVARFFAALQAFDDYLASDEPMGAAAERLFQGPVADALTHVGQLATLRRLAGAPVKAENYYVAEIVAGRVGVEQAMPVREF